MVSSLLVKGMIVGALAGLLAFGFARTFGEPSVDRAIAIEEAGGAEAHVHEIPSAVQPAAEDAAAMASHDEAAPAASGQGDEEEEIVSRTTQAGVGLLTATVVYGAAFGGIFALVFAFAWGRVGKISPRSLAAVLALIGFVVLIVVPQIKYPANPPAVGHGETIGYRTATFLAMLVLSIVAAAIAAYLRDRLLVRLGAWNATIVAAVVFVAVVAAAMFAFPAINEVPEAFPAVLLWQFRLASLGTQAVLWGVLGLAFGFVAERQLARAG